MADSSPLKVALDRFIDGIRDIAHLEVCTYTGEVASILDGEEIDWGSLKPTNAKIRLVAATRIGPDLDTTNFRSSDASAEELRAVMEVHEAALDSALAGRAALIKLVKDMIT